MSTARVVPLLLLLCASTAHATPTWQYKQEHGLRLLARGQHYRAVVVLTAAQRTALRLRRQLDTSERQRALDGCLWLVRALLESKQETVFALAQCEAYGVEVGSTMHTPEVWELWRPGTKLLINPFRR